jgi:Cu-Zn family superoxide dismutase
VEPVPPEEAIASAQAELRDVAGRTLAHSSVTQIGETLRIRVEAAGLSSGIYGVHVHSVGRCQAPSFESAGPHWNPSNRLHGRDNPGGQHRGDLPNLMVGTDGNGSFEFTIQGSRLSGRNSPLLDQDGASIVIHARPDDYRTDPSGNSGARIACGELG